MEPAPRKSGLRSLAGWELAPLVLPTGGTLGDRGQLCCRAAGRGPRALPHCTLATVPPTRNSAIFLRSLAGGSGVLSSPGSSGQPSLAWAALRTLRSAALGRKRDLGWALAAPRGRFSSAAASGPSCTGGLWSCPRSRWQAGTCSVTWRPLPSEGGARKGCQPVRAHSREGWGSPPPGGHRWNCWTLDGGGAGTVAQTPTKPGAWAAQSLNLSRPGLALLHPQPSQGSWLGADFSRDSWQSPEMDWCSVCLQTQRW